MPEYLITRARAAAGDARASLALARDCGAAVPLPGSGRTGERWDVLRRVAAVDLTVVRVLEPHVDALAIIDEARLGVPSGTWGVWAAEAPGVGLHAHRDGAGWTLSGTKPWCSLAALLDRALVTADTAEGRRLFAVELHHPGVRVLPTGWVARGLVQVGSGPVAFDQVSATPVGGPGWYLDRPGFAWGGMGVAACWLGGAEAVYATLLAAAPQDEVRRADLGAVDAALHAADRVLADAARQCDTGAGPPLLAARVRAVVADAVATTLRRAGEALGPRPLAFDAEHARRVADLELYARQFHGGRDLAALGALLL